MAQFQPAIDSVYQYEGGFQKQAADTGNYYNGKLIGTNLGITPNAYKAYYKKEPTEQIMKSLTKSVASPIYRKNYWDKIRGDEIANDSVAKMLMDIVVNSGTGMIKSFKQIMNATSGKNIVSVTTTPFTSAEIKLLNALPQDIYFKNIVSWRENFYKALVQKRPSNSIYLKGWLNRLNKHTYSGAVLKPSINTKTLAIVGTSVLLAGLGWYFRDEIKQVFQ